jgi:PAS domain S-box-containing protein
VRFQTRTLKYSFFGIALSAVLSAVALGVALRDWRSEDAKDLEAFRSVAETVSRAISVKIDLRLSGLSALQGSLIDGSVGASTPFAVAATLVNKSAGGYLALNLIDSERRIVQVWPEDANRAVLGRTVGQSPAIVELLDEAIAKDEPRATGIVDLFQGGKGIAAYFPLQSNDRFTGFLNAVFRLGDLDADLLSTVPTGFQLHIASVAAAPNHTHVPALIGDRYFISFDQRVLNQVLHINIDSPKDPHEINNRILAISWQIALCALIGLTLSGYLIWTRKSRAEEALLASVLKSSPIAFVSVDRQGKIVKFNPAAEAMFGYASAQMLSQPIEVLVPVNNRTKHANHVAEFFRSPVEHQYMGDWRWIEAVHANGSRFHISVLLTKAIVDGDQITTAMLTDMTGEQTRQRELLKLVEERAAAAERAESASKSKTMFLASMSHELRTPLNAIIGFSDLMNQEIFGPIQPPKYQEYLHDIHDSAQGLLALINDILDYSKMEAGALNFSNDLFDITDVLDQSVRTAAGIAMEKGLFLKFEPVKKLPNALGDPRATRQVLLNLMSNAVKFSPKGGTIRIRTSFDTSKKEIVVEIQDDGPGISKKDIPNLGKPFYQARDNSYIASEGTGLGLAICFGLMRSMDGRIEFDSDRGHGTIARAVFKAADTTSN